MNTILQSNVVITLENSTEYEYWKTVDSYTDLYLNLDKVLAKDVELEKKLPVAVGKLYGASPGLSKAVQVLDEWVRLSAHKYIIVYLCHAPTAQ